MIERLIMLSDMIMTLYYKFNYCITGEEAKELRDQIKEIKKRVKELEEIVERS